MRRRGTAEQWIKEGKNAVKWTRLSCCTMSANAVRLQLHVLAYNMANFLRTFAWPEEMVLMVADHDPGEAGEDRRQGDPTPVTASSRWPRSPCRVTCSGVSSR
jgi:hypothetical protein